MMINPRQLSNRDAGIWALALVAAENPGITFKQLLEHGRRRKGKTMGGWWTDFKSGIGDVKDGIGDIFSDTVDMIGRKGGETIRLATDEQVVDGVSRYGMAYATGGGSELLTGLLGPSGVGFIEQLGINTKGSTGGIKNEYLILGGGAVLLVVLIMMISKG